MRTCEPCKERTPPFRAGFPKAIFREEPRHESEEKRHPHASLPESELFTNLYEKAQSSVWSPIFSSGSGCKSSFPASPSDSIGPPARIGGQIMTGSFPAVLRNNRIDPNIVQQVSRDTPAQLGRNVDVHAYKWHTNESPNHD